MMKNVKMKEEPMFSIDLVTLCYNRIPSDVVE